MTRNITSSSHALVIAGPYTSLLTVASGVFHAPRNPAALFPAGHEHQRRVVVVEWCVRVQGFGHVDRHGAAVASPPLHAGVMTRCPPASGGDAAPRATGLTVGLQLQKRRR